MGRGRCSQANSALEQEQVAHAIRPLPQYVADCYLCPRNTRVSGAVNDDYPGVFVFDNDLCTALIASEAGVVLTDPLDAARSISRWNAAD